MKSWLQKNYLSVIGIFVGAITGYFYWKEVGCASGTCMISSKPLNSTLYFAVLGFLVFSMFKKTTSHVK
jgi:hypothetical protein